jgi:hypothetical protein
MDDPRCKGLQQGMVVEIEDFRCASLLSRMALEIDDHRCRHTPIQTEDPRCENLHKIW